MRINIKKPNLTTYQHAFLYNAERFTFTEASTKVGKTFAHIWWIFERAHEPWNKAGYNHWWVAPVYGQTKIAFKRLKNKVVKSGVYQINETNLTITCPNGAIIHFRSAEKPDNLYGEDVYSVVFDEAPRARVDAYYALRSTITATGGKIKLIGNFGGVANWMHQLKEKAKTDDQYAYYRVTAWQAVEEGILSRNEIEQAQKDLPENVFKQLYLAEASENTDQLIPFSVINDMWSNSFVEEGTKYITADIALHGSDVFVVAVWSGWRVIDIIATAKCDAKEVEELLRKLIQTHKVQISNVIYDADGLGSFLRGYLRGATAFNNGARPFGKTNYKNLKSQCGYLFAKHATESSIFISTQNHKTELIEELECLQSYNLDADGKIQLLPKAEVKKMIGRSPDFLDALVMRAFFIAKPQIKVVSSGLL